jgi:hypothetical protein
LLLLLLEVLLLLLLLLLLVHEADGCDLAVETDISTATCQAAEMLCLLEQERQEAML